MTQQEFAIAFYLYPGISTGREFLFKEDCEASDYDTDLDVWNYFCTFPEFLTDIQDGNGRDMFAEYLFDIFFGWQPQYIKKMGVQAPLSEYQLSQTFYNT